MNELAKGWELALGLPAQSPAWAASIVALLFIYGAVILPSGAIISYFERKLSGDLQARVGPNRAGPWGTLQPIADLLKLLQKEGERRASWRERLWTSVHTMALYSTVAVLPLGSLALLVDTDMSAFLPFWAALILALGTMLVGLNQGTVPGALGGVRVAAQALAGAFPALLCLLCAGMHAGGFRWTEFAMAQGASPFSWAAITNPFQAVAFVIFMVSGLVLLGMPPLDGGLSVADIHGGVASRLQGQGLSLFRLGRFYGFFLWTVIGVTLFLGAWRVPEVLDQALRDNGIWWLLMVVELLTVLTKTFAVMISVVLVAQVTPRSRADQVTDLSWRVLSPLALAALMGSAVWAALFQGGAP